MRDPHRCDICGGTFGRTCENTFLCKLTMDHFTYLVGLKSGRVLKVEHGTKITEKWIRFMPDEDLCGYPCPRGIDVKISEIEWIVDAPEGS